MAFFYLREFIVLAPSYIRSGVAGIDLLVFLEKGLVGVFVCLGEFIGDLIYFFFKKGAFFLPVDL